MKRTYNPGITECAGTCGRLLRSSRITLKEAPGTVSRHANNMCQRCNAKAGIKTTGQQEAIRPCRACNHPTRPQRMRALDAPGTRSRVGDLCRRCDLSCEWVEPAVVTAATEALNAYIRARRARGVPAEGYGHLELAA